MADPESLEFEFDAFISYSHANGELARRLEDALEAYRPPTGLGLPDRHLNVFRDAKDIRGADYFQAIEGHLVRSRKLVVLCSPAARASEFVNDEIRRFCAARSPGDIVPVLVAGIPNNEVRPGGEAHMAFPEALCAVLEMPLAMSYVGWLDEHVDAEPFLDAWYTLLANICQVSRSELEQRDQHKRARDRASTSRELVAHGLQLLEDDPALSARLAAQAALVTYLADGTLGSEAEELLHRARVAAIRKRTAPRAILAGHRAAVWRAGFSPDGARLLTVSEDCTMTLWDVASARELGSIAVNPPAPIKALAFSPDGACFATAQLDGSAKLWRSHDGRALGRLDHGGPLSDIAFCPDGSLLATACLDGTATVWDTATWKSVLQVQLGAAAMEQDASEPRALRAPSGAEDSTGPSSLADPIALASSLVAPVTAVAFSPDGRRLLAAGKFGDAYLWDVASHAVVTRLRGHTATVMSAAFSPDGSAIATAGLDGTVRVFDATTGHEQLVLRGDTPEFLAVAFSADGRSLAAASREKTAEIWAWPGGRKRFTLAGHRGGVWGVAFSPDGHSLVTASYDRTARIWDVADRASELPVLSGHTDNINALAFHPDGSRLASGAWDGTIRCWELGRAEQVLCIAHHRAGAEAAGKAAAAAAISSVAWSPDGTHLASASGDGSSCVFDAATGALVTRLAHDAAVLGVAWSPDGSRLATAGYDQLGALWDVRAGRRLGTLSGHAGELIAVAFSPDGSRIATASKDGTARIWDAASCAELTQLGGHTEALNAVVFAPSGNQVITASEDNTARIWDVRSGRSIATLTGHKGLLTALAISPDGARIATASRDRTVKLWKTATRGAPVTLSAHTEEVWAVAISPDGRRLASGGKDCLVIVQTLDPADLIRSARACAGRELSSEERDRYLAGAAELALPGDLP